MKEGTGIGRRELFRKLAGSAGAVAMAAALPGSAASAVAAVSSPPMASETGDQRSPLQSSSDSATVRVILADGTTVQWLAVTNGGLTVGGTTTISSAPPGLNKSIILGAIRAIVAAGGPQLTGQQVTLFGGKAT
jgi:hypothetical protein